MFALHCSAKVKDSAASKAVPANADVASGGTSVGRSGADTSVLARNTADTSAGELSSIY